MSKIEFNKIPGLIGEMCDLPFEMTLRHDNLDVVREALTVENNAVKYQYSRAKKALKKNKDEMIGMEEAAKVTGKIDKNRYTTIKAKVTKFEAELEELKPDLTKRYYGENDDGTLNAPSGFHWMCEKIVDDKHLNTEVPFVPWPESTGKALRDYQEESVKAALKFKRSSIVLPTGCGKSLVIFALLNCYLTKGLRVCILEPTVELVRQMYEEAQKYFLQVSALGGIYKYKLENTLLISTVQSAGAYIDRYDVVIIDEFQHASCPTIEETLFSAVNAQYCHGFTACPVRADGLTLGIHAACGPVVMERDTKWALKNNWLTPPNVVMMKVMSPKRLPDLFNAARAYSNLMKKPLLCETIVTITMKTVTKGRKCLIILKTVGESFALKEYFKGKAEVEVASSEYRAGLYKFKKGECSVLIANSGLLSEGVDIPLVDSLINVTQFSSENMTRQILGRGLRLLQGKKDLFFCDIALMGYGQFERAYWSRKKIYETIVDNIRELTITDKDV